MSNRRGSRRSSGRATAWAALGVPVAACVLLACQKPAEDLSRASAERIYLVRCSRCHEPDGSSLTASAKTNHDIDFRDPEWQLTFDDAAIRKIATFGQGKMLGVAGITEAELDSVIVHVRRLGARGAGAADPAAGGPLESAPPRPADAAPR